MTRKQIKKFIYYFIILLAFFTIAYLISFLIVKFTVKDALNSETILLKGDWYYTCDGSDSDTITIVGISDAGKEKSILIIPEEIDGKQVRAVNYSLDYCTDEVEKGVLKTVYIKHAVQVSGFSNAKNLEKFVVVLDYYSPSNWGGVGVDYGLTNIYRCNQGYKIDTAKISGTVNVYYANVSYLYNYDVANNNGFYWVDNYDYGEKIEFVPENPTREGYTFGGWYKEESCENKWDFNNDRLPEIKKGAQGETLYQETKLYAKWIAN